MKRMLFTLFCLSFFCTIVAAQETTQPEVPQVEALPPQVEALPPQVEALPPQVEAPPPQVESPPPQVEALPPQPVAPVVEAKEPIKFHLGLRAGFGLSQFRGHVALKTPDDSHLLELDPSLAVSVGFITQIGINKLISIAPELQWSLYRASKELEAEADNNTYNEQAAIVGVYLHALELPVLARFNFGSAYAEIGPQIGFNLYSRVYKNANYYDPDIGLIAFGVAAGGGIELGGILLGARTHFGFLEYSKDYKGIPWNFEFNVGKFFF
jgi:hypothetical protein